MVHSNFLGFQGQSFNQIEIGISGQSSKNPEERLFILIVWFSWDVKVLQVTLAMEGDLAGFYFSVFLIDFVSNQNNGDVITDSGEIFIPLWHVFVGDSGGDIEHEDGSVSTNIISLTKSSKLFLSCGIPEWELNWAMVSVESDWANFNTLSGNIFLLEFSGNVSLDKGGLSYSSVSDQNNLELCYYFRSLH